MSQCVLSRRVAPCAEAIGGARRAVRACAARAGAADPEGVAVAVSEALTNAVVHAYAGVAPADIDVTVAVDGDAARVVVADRGRGMRPRADSPGAGLGLPLMAALSREMEVAGRPGGGTRLALWFALA